MLSLPNLLTLSRIFAVPLLVALLWDAGWLGYFLAFLLYAVAGSCALIGAVVILRVRGVR